MTELPDQTQPPKDPAAAREEAADYMGFLAAKTVPLNDGSTIDIPNPSMFDDDTQERWDEFQMFLESCERYPDRTVPAHKITVNGNEVFVPETTIVGDVLRPLRRKNDEGKVERVKPGYEVRLAQAVLGEDGYRDAHANGLQATDVALYINEMQKRYNDRKASDSKSRSGS